MKLLDVRTKILVLCFANYLLLARVKDYHEWLFVGYLVLLFYLAKRLKKGVIYLVIFAILYSIDTFLWRYTTGDISSLLSMMSIGFRMMLPCFMAGSYLFSTTRASQLIAGLRKWHVPEQILLTFAVMFRFLPSIMQDYKAIQQSLKIRGIFLTVKDSICHPIAYFEYVTVPLIMSTSRTAQELTVAAMIKSVDKQHVKTIYKNTSFTMIDWLSWLYMIANVCMIEWVK